MANFTDSLRQLKTLLNDGDVRGAIIYLNGLTEHRFTSLYRFDNQTLTNVYFYDRENPTQKSTPDIPIMASYCIFIRNSQSTFTTVESLQDDRLQNHPKQLEVRSYCGIPLLDENGKMFGTICHFDFQPTPISNATVKLMESVAPLLKKVTMGRIAPSFP